MSIKDDMEDVQEAVINELISDNGLNPLTVGDLQITTTKIADDAVTLPKLGSDVDLGQVNDDAVTLAKLGSDVDLGQVNDGAVTPDKLSQAYLPLTGGSVTGNVKIGDPATDITSKLVVSGNASASVATFMYDGAAGTYLSIDCNAPNGVVDLDANARSGNYPPLTFTTGASERMRIDSSGNVLVGKSSNLAGAKTLVAGTKSGTNGTNGQLVVLDEQAYSTTDNGGGISFAGNFYNGGQIVFATVQGVKENNTDANNAGALKFTTKANGGNQVEAMRIDSQGRIIISNIPTSASGLSTGTIYSDGGTLKIV